MVQRRGLGVGRKVVHGGGGQHPVFHRKDGGQGRGPHGFPLRGRQKGQRCSQHRNDHHNRGGQDPAHPRGPEPRQVDAAGRANLAQQVPGDQEPGDREEHVDPDETAGDQLRSEVVARHEQHRDGAQRLDLWQDSARKLRFGGHIREQSTPG